MKNNKNTKTKLRKLFVLSNLFLLLFLLSPQPVLASTLFNITHETGDLSEYGWSTDDEDLSVAGAAALAGTSYGMQVVIDDTDAMYGEKVQGFPASGEIRFRGYFDPNSLSMAVDDALDMMYLGTSTWGVIEQWYLAKTADTYRLWLIFYDDNGWLSTKIVDITDEPHYIEDHLERESSDGAGDGRYRVWVDGVLWWDRITMSITGMS